MVAGFSAGSYLKLVKGTFSDKGRQSAKGIYQIGEFGGIPTFKAPSSIIPTNEIMCVKHLSRRTAVKTAKAA